MADAGTAQESEEEEEMETDEETMHIAPETMLHPEAQTSLEAMTESLSICPTIHVQQDQAAGHANLELRDLLSSEESRELAMRQLGGEGRKTAILAQNNQGSIVGHQKIVNKYEKCTFPQPPPESDKLQNLIASTYQQLKTSCPQGYVETPALGQIMKHLEHKGTCLILGLAGHGKTTLALQAMARIAAKHDMQPVCLERPKDWQLIPGEGGSTEKIGEENLTGTESNATTASGGSSDSKDKTPTVSSSCRRYVVLVEDMFGKGNFNDDSFEGWEKKLPAMLAKVRAGQVKLIMVSRSHIFQQCRNKLMQNELFQNLDTVQLQDVKYWDKSCMKAILQAFLMKHKVEFEIPESALQSVLSCRSIGFPQCCAYFASHPQALNLGEKFFENPLPFLCDQVKAMKASEIETYFVLILTLIQNGHLSESFLSDDTGLTNQKLIAAGNACGLKGPLNIGEVRQRADSLCDVYLTKSYDGDGYRFSHWSLCDCLIVELCETNLKLALDTCSLSQLCEYIRTENCVQGEAEIIYKVQKSHWNMLASRISKELISGQDFRAMLHHPCLKDKEFWRTLQDHFHASDRGTLLGKSFPLTVNLNNQKVFSLKSAPSVMILEKVPRLANLVLFSDEMVALPSSDRKLLLQEALTAACFISDMSCVRQLLSRGAETTEEVCLAACFSPTADVKLFKKMYEELPLEERTSEVIQRLILLCFHTGKLQNLKYLLHEAHRPEGFQSAVSEAMNKLFLATHPLGGGPGVFPQSLHLRLTAVFEEMKAAGAAPDSGIPVTFAASHQHPFVLRELINNGADCEAPDGNGLTPMLSASGLGSEKCLQVIIEVMRKKGKPNNVNHKSMEGITSLHLAVRQNHIALVNILLQNGADPNLTDPEGMLPLHLCLDHSPNKDLEIFKSLLERTRNLAHQDQLGRTPLHIAAQRCKYDAMVVLLGKEEEREKNGLKKACDVEDQFKMRPLHVHCFQSHDHQDRKALKEKTQMEKLLVKMSSDINAQDVKGNTALHLAAENCDLTLMELLVEQKARPDLMNGEGASVVHSFCRSKVVNANRERKEHMLDLLVSKEKVDVNLKDAFGRTPLLLAAEADSNLVKTLVKHKAKWDVSDKKKDTVFHYLARHRFQPQDKHSRGNRFYQGPNADFTLLRKGSREALNAQNAAGETALHIAAANGNHILVQALINHGARADILNHAKQSVLHKFCMRMHWNDTKRIAQFFKYLQTQGVDLNAQDDLFCTPLHYASRNHDFSSMEALLGLKAESCVLDSNNEIPLHSYAMGSSSNPLACWNTMEILQMEKLLVKATKLINQQNHQGFTPLHCAAVKKTLTLMKALLEKNADVDLVNNTGHSTLHAYASAPEGFWSSVEPQDELRQDVEELLLQKSASLDLPAKNGETPLHTAAVSGCWTLVTKLLKEGAKVDVFDKFGRLPLHSLASRSLLEMNTAVQLLVQKTKNVNHKDKDGCSPLHVAAAHSNRLVAEVLIENGADVNLYNSRHRTPLHESATTVYSPAKLKLVKLLIDHETTNINCQDSDGQTPLHLAILTTDVFLIELLLRKDARTDIPNAKEEVALLVMAGQDTMFFDIVPHFFYFLVKPFLTAWKNVYSLLTQKAGDINITNSEGKTALHLSVSQRNLLMAEALMMEKRARTDLPDKQMFLPLHLLAGSAPPMQPMENYQRLCSLLVENTNDLNKRAENGETPLHIAAVSGNYTMMKLLMENQKVNLKVADNAKELPVHAYAKTPVQKDATEKDCVEHLLLSRTMGINARNSQEQTPLHLAASCGNVSFMKSLLQRNADVNAEDITKRTPLHYFAHFASWNQNLSLGENSDRPGEDSTKLCQEMGTLLVQKTQYINKQDVEGWSPLHLAVGSTANSLTKSLLEHSAHTDLKDAEMRTALHIRARTPCLRRIITDRRVLGIPVSQDSDHLLMEKTKNLNMIDMRGETPLHNALAVGNFPVAELLVRHGANVNIQNDQKQLALHMFAISNTKKYFYESAEQKSRNGADEEEPRIQHAAATSDKSASKLLNARPEFGKLLVQTTGDINSQDCTGRTALHGAAATRNFSVVKILLEKKARTDLQDECGQIPLHVYSDSRNDVSQPFEFPPPERQRIDELFVKKTEDLNVADGSGRTPIHYAAMNDNLHLVQTLLRNDAKTDFPEKESALLVYSKRQYTESSKADATEMRNNVDDTLVRKAEDIDVVDENENAPLHYAARQDDLHLMEALMKGGASCNLKTNEGATCLHVYAKRKMYKAQMVVSEQSLDQETRNRIETNLIKKTKEIDAATSAPPKHNPLQIAASLGDFALIEKLLEHNARTDVRNGNNMTVLHLYAARSRLEGPDRVPARLHTSVRLRVDRLMVEKAADINALTTEGDTALHLAARNDDLSLTEQLLQRGARADLQNQAGQLALHDFASRRRADSELFRESRGPVSKLLVEKTANVNVKDKEGRRPLDLAKKHDDFLLVQLLSDRNEA